MSADLESQYVGWAKAQSAVPTTAIRRCGWWARCALPTLRVTYAAAAKLTWSAPSPLWVATSCARAERVGEGGTQQRLSLRTPTPTPPRKGEGSAPSLRTQPRVE